MLLIIISNKIIIQLYSLYFYHPKWMIKNIKGGLAAPIYRKIMFAKIKDDVARQIREGDTSAISSAEEGMI